MRSLSALLLLAIALGAAACGDEDEAPGPPAGETISYSRTGGFVGLSENLEIDPAGDAVLEIGPPEESTSRFEVSQSQIEDLRNLADAAGFTNIETDPEPTGCADCFLYEITIGAHTISGDDTNFPKELAPLRDQLQQIVDENRGR